MASNPTKQLQETRTMASEIKTAHDLAVQVVSLDDSRHRGYECSSDDEVAVARAFLVLHSALAEVCKLYEAAECVGPTRSERERVAEIAMLVGVKVET